MFSLFFHLFQKYLQLVQIVFDISCLSKKRSQYWEFTLGFSSVVKIHLQNFLVRLLYILINQAFLSQWHCQSCLTWLNWNLWSWKGGRWSQWGKDFSCKFTTGYFWGKQFPSTNSLSFQYPLQTHFLKLGKKSHLELVYAYTFISRNDRILIAFSIVSSSHSTALSPCTLLDGEHSQKLRRCNWKKKHKYDGDGNKN